MKREIDGLVYRTTLQFLDDRIEMYESFKRASDGGRQDQTEFYDGILDSCKEIRKAFLSTFTAKKRKYERKNIPLPDLEIFE